MIPRILRAAAVAAALLSTAAPFTSQAAAVRSLLEMRREGVVMQTWDTSCGAAALATVLTYQLGSPVSEVQVVQWMLRHTDPERVRRRGGFSLLDMKRFAESRSFSAAGYARLTVVSLQELAPVIVPMRTRRSDHFVVFRGVAAGNAVLADPAFGNRTLDLDRFEQSWADGIGLVVGDRETSANHMSPDAIELFTVDDGALRARAPGALAPALRLTAGSWAPGGTLAPGSAQNGAASAPASHSGSNSGSSAPAAGSSTAPAGAQFTVAHPGASTGGASPVPVTVAPGTTTITLQPPALSPLVGVGSR